MSKECLKAPFPYFGGKSKVATVVWAKLGDVTHYIEPFFGSGAILLSRPQEHVGRVETVNDIDGYVANFWRAVQYSPNEVVAYADGPVNECDLHARHLWLIQQKFVGRLMADPHWHCPKIAGWWLWGTCAWIGHGFCSGKGPWSDLDGVLSYTRSGRGINKQLPHITRGRGINKQLPHIGGGQGRREFIRDWIMQLQDRLRDVRVACGDWSRITRCTEHATGGTIGYFLDPPYTADCCEVYNNDADVSAQVREFAIKKGEDSRYRIALCGYDGEHEMPVGWECFIWKANGGYGNASGNKNAFKERIWFSPGCMKS